MRAVRAARRAAGFLVIAAVFLIVVLAGLVAYMMTVSTTSQAASAADLNSSRAYQSARAGAEWAAYLILQTAGGANTLRTQCETGTSTKTLPLGSALAGFTVTVTCTSIQLTEGAGQVRSYTITSNACNEPAAGACPNGSTTSSTYVDREVTLTITD